MLRPRACLLALVVAPIAVGCGDDEHAVTGTPPDEIRYELQPWARELDPATLAAISSTGPEDGTLRFQGEPAKLAGLKKDDVLVAGVSPTTPDGILRQVESVSTEGSETIVKVHPVPVQLAFKHLHARVTAQATKLDGTEDTTATRSIAPLGKYSTSKSVGEGKEISWRVFDQDKNPETKDDQLYVKGGAKGSVTITAYIDLDWLDDPEKIAKELACFGTFPLCVPDLPDVVVGAKLDAKASIGVEAEGAAAKAFDSDEFAISDSEITLPTIAAGPVVIKPSIDFVAQISGSATARFRSAVGISYGTSTEISIGTKSGPKFVPPNVPKPEYQPPVVEVSLGSDVKVAVGPRVSLLFWDSFGPSVSLTAYGKLHADSEKTPCWTIGSGADANIGIRVRIPWKLFGLEDLGKVLGLTGDLASKTFGPYSIFAIDDVLTGACGALPPNVYPPGEGPTDEVYKNPTFTPWSRRYLDFDTRFPFSGEISEANLHTDKTVDGAWLVAGKGIQGVVKMSESGDIVWAKRLRLPGVGDEEVAFDEAKSAFAVQALDTNIWVATSRFTVMKLDQDGDLVWANRYRTADKLLPFAIGPTGLVPLPDGGALVQYGIEETPNDGPAILFRIDKRGNLLWSKTFKWETEKTFAPVLVADGDEVTLAGYSWEPGSAKAHLARLRADGSVVYAKTLNVCDDARVRPAHGIRLGSKAIAIAGTYDMAPDRSFIAQISPDGASASVGSWWTGDGLKDDRTNSVAQLPVTGFLTAAVGVPISSESLLLAQHDAQGNVTLQRELFMKDATGAWDLRPGALRMTNDGGVLVFTHLTSAASNTGPFRSGLWVSKLPARTLDGPFDPAFVQPGTQTSAGSGCSIALGNDTFAPTDLPLTTVDVGSTIVVEALTPKVEKMIP